MTDSADYPYPSGRPTSVSICCCTMGTNERRPPAPRAVRRTQMRFMAALASLVVAAAVPAARGEETTGSRVSTEGWGAIKIGMTPREATEKGGIALSEPGAIRNECSYISPRDPSLRIAFMLTRGRIVRIDVAKRGIRTTSGIRVGDTEASVRRRLSGRLRVQPHVYTNGSYLEFVPRDRQDRNRRVVFETTSGKVTYIRAGRLPEVRRIEGCS